MRPEFTGSLPSSIRAVIDHLNHSIDLLDELMEFNHDALVVRQLMPAQKELTRARASLSMAAIAAEQQEDK